MRLSALIISVAAGFLSATAGATVPPDVMKEYKTYMQELKAGDREGARKSARKAYDAAEKLMPDNPQTGALAENLADLLGEEETDEALKLYARSLSFAGDDTERRADVLSKMARTHMYRKTRKAGHFRKARQTIDELSDVIKAGGLLQSTVGAESKVYEGWALYNQGREAKALETLNEAIAIFESPVHTYFSVLEYQAYLMKGSMLNYEKKPIEAALSLQKVMQNLEGELPADHPFIKTAFSDWLWSRSLITTDGRTSEALKMGVCQCWPYDKMAEDGPVPIVRTPPDMPRNARRSGRVLVKFDVDGNGNVVSPVVQGYTDQLFVKPSLKSLEGWKYDVTEDVPEETRKGVLNTITYRLTDQSGKILPESEMQMVVKEGQ